MSGLTGQYVTLGLGEDLFAVPVTSVQEILDLRPISPLPHAPAHLLGVIDVRGANVSVVSLRAILGLPPVEDTVESRIVVLRIAMNGVERQIAMKTDRVIEVTGMDEGRLDPLTETRVLRWDARCVAGMARREGRFVAVLDLGTMLAGRAPADGVAGDFPADGKGTLVA